MSHQIFTVVGLMFRVCKHWEKYLCIIFYKQWNTRVYCNIFLTPVKVMKLLCIIWYKKSCFLHRAGRESDFKSNYHSTGFIVINYPSCGLHIYVEHDSAHEWESWIYALTDHCDVYFLLLYTLESYQNGTVPYQRGTRKLRTYSL